MQVAARSPRIPARPSRHPLLESVCESLLEAILSGRLSSGTVLSEVASAEQLTVSRTPVHDALRQLAKDGLVEQTAGRRARVARFSGDDWSRKNGNAASDNGSQFLAEDFKEFIRICGMTHVRTSPRYPQSNGKLGRLHGSIKGECIRPVCRRLPDRKQRVTMGNGLGGG